VRNENGKKLEPVERLVIDIPENFIGIIMETIGSRRGEMLKMSNHGSGRVRLDFKIPSRGLIGLRSQLLTDTRGTALIHSIFEGWMEYGGDMALRPTGALVADRPGLSTAYALWGLQERGELFIGPTIEVYEGMVVGENSREQDMEVNVTKEKKLTNMRSSSADEAIRLIPHRNSAWSRPSNSSPTTSSSKSPQNPSACARKSCSTASARAAGRKSAPARKPQASAFQTRSNARIRAATACRRR